MKPKIVKSLTEAQKNAMNMEFKNQMRQYLDTIKLQDYKTLFPAFPESPVPDNDIAYEVNLLIIN